MREKTAVFGFCLLFTASILGCAFTSGLSFSAVPTGAEPQETSLAVLMYHQVSQDPTRIGDYVITPDQFRQDLTALHLAGFSPVSAAQLVDYAQGRASLPPNPVLLTFDDGYETFYTDVFPILKETNTPAVLSLVGKYTDFYSYTENKALSYSHVTWEEVQELAASPLVELGNHTYALHQMAEGKRRGMMPLEGEDEEAYRALVEADLVSCSTSIQEQTGEAPRVFAYPFGLYTDATREVVEQMGFDVILTCESRLNSLELGEPLPPLGRFNRRGALSSQEVAAMLQEGS